MKAYRDWLPAAGYEGTGSLGGSYYSDNIEDYYLTPYELGYGPHRQVRPRLRRAGGAREDGRRTRPAQKVTLAWNGEDVARAMGTMFQEEGRAKYIDLPLSNYSTWPNDKVLKDGKMVGVSTFSGYSSNESSMLSLAMVDIEQSEPGTEVTLVWGEEGGGSAQAGGRAPRADRDPGDRRARSLRRGRPHLVPAATSVGAGRRAGSGSTGRSPGRSWCTSGGSGASSTGPTAAPRRARSGFSGLGLWHADLEHVLETRSLREMKQVFDDNGLRHLELEFLMDWFLDPDDERRRGLRRDPRAALPTRRRSSMRTTSRSATSPARRRSSRSSPSASASSAPMPPSTPTRRSSTSSCPST